LPAACGGSPPDGNGDFIEQTNRKEFALKKEWIILASMLLCFSALSASAQDRSGCKDHPLFPTRMPDYSIGDCKVEEFGVYNFKQQRGKTIPVEGKFTFLTYNFTGAKGSEPSPTAVLRNYENAIKKVGGTILETFPNYWENAKILKDGAEVWVEAERGNGKIWLRIVEKKAMEQYVQADAAAFGNDIRTTGHASVYGIYFDTGKSTIKPESVQAMGEIAKLLKSDATLRIHVVGHTDNAGGIESNIALSKARAEAVLQALIRDHGIAATRLTSFGCGQFAPVASNDSEEGRAKNRRVDLVKQ
jgi:OmpA-OmpF porin, OOP family